MASRRPSPSTTWTSIFYEGEVVSIVGESGSGKTTLAKMLLGLINHTEGEIYFQGKKRDIAAPEEEAGILEEHPGHLPGSLLLVQHVQQDRCGAAGLHQHARREAVCRSEEKVELMTEACSFVNLKFEELTNKYPFELSGGQMQRLMIARIFLLKPKILLADEPTSMIDACSRATILDDADEAARRNRDDDYLSSPTISAWPTMCPTRSTSWSMGRFVESGSADEVILHPQAPYTKRLISDVPKIHEEWDLSTV